MNDEALLRLHRDLVSIPSVSGEEQEVAAFLARAIQGQGVPARVIQRGVLAMAGEQGPVLVLNSHLDTVPPGDDWSREPWRPEVQEGRVYGLGSNDAKASVAAMTAAFLRIARSGLSGVRLALAMASEEETRGSGSPALREALEQEGWAPAAALIGEPTGMMPAISQKGLTVVEVRGTGVTCHAAHAAALGARNAIRELARGIVRLEHVSLGPEDQLLGPVTIEPTMIQGGTARNVVPGSAICIFDIRTNPGTETEELVGRLREVTGCEVRVLSDRLQPCQVDSGDPLVLSILEACPWARPFASRGVSDWVAFRDLSAVKIGPGMTERSHIADEFVLEREVTEGASAYETIVRAWARRMSR